MMDFKRARSASQKAERKNEIKNRALQIFVERGYEEITFVNIAEDLSIKRPLIYTYYGNVADIMLDALSDKLDGLLQIIAEANDEQQVFKDILDYIIEDKALLKMIAIYKVVIEPAASLDSLVEYEFKLTKFHHNYENLLISYHPEWNRKAIRDKFTLFWSLLIGMANINSTTEKQSEAFKSIGHEPAKVDIKLQIQKLMAAFDNA